MGERLLFLDFFTDDTPATGEIPGEIISITPFLSGVTTNEPSPSLSPSSDSEGEAGREEEEGGKEERGKRRGLKGVKFRLVLPVLLRLPFR